MNYLQIVGEGVFAGADTARGDLDEVPSTAGHGWGNGNVKGSLLQRGDIRIGVIIGGGSV